jgi:hypothetical protein
LILSWLITWNCHWMQSATLTGISWSPAKAKFNCFKLGMGDFNENYGFR